jgi:hypothetical protein
LASELARHPMPSVRDVVSIPLFQPQFRCLCT